MLISAYIKLIMTVSKGLEFVLLKFNKGTYLFYLIIEKG